MKVLAIGQLTGKDIGPYLQAERHRVAELRAEGLVMEAFGKADRSGPILLLNDTDSTAARARLASLPFVQHGLVTFDYIELDEAGPD